MHPESYKMRSLSLISGERWITWTAVMFIASIATLVESYLVVKVLFLALFLLAFLANVYLGRTRVIVYRRLVWFYVWIGLAGLVWAIVGALHPANYIQAVFSALRLYIIWSAAFVVLFTILRTVPSLQVVHYAIVAAGILIPLINFVGLYDEFTGLGFISEGIRKQLEMNIGIGDGYIQITSKNIDLMFLIAPYLLSLQFRADPGKSNSLLTKVALVLSMILVVVSGRRALWIVVALTPFTILLLSRLTGGYGLIKTGGRRFLFGSAAASVLALSLMLILPEGASDFGPINRFKEAFSSEDERSIQAPYLINGFRKSPVLGSGFGGYAGYIRSDEQPWDYELTYHQMLFNLGIVGVISLGALFLVYFGAVVRLLRQFKDESTVPFALLVGYCSFFIGAYSNPYFGSFDLLFFVGLLPYLSTFQHGFGELKLAAGTAV
jgi:hypothetical protein